MTEFEIISIFTNGATELRESALNFVTVLFAFVLAAHLVGKSLPRAIAIFASLIYSFFLLGPIGSMYRAIVQMDVAATLYRASYPAGSILQAGSDPAVLMILSIGPLIIGWIGSLVYMHSYIRTKQVQ